MRREARRGGVRGLRSRAWIFVDPMTWRSGRHPRQTHRARVRRPATTRGRNVWLRVHGTARARAKLWLPIGRELPEQAPTLRHQPGERSTAPPTPRAPARAPTLLGPAAPRELATRASSQPHLLNRQLRVVDVQVWQQLRAREEGAGRRAAANRLQILVIIAVAVHGAARAPSQRSKLLVLSLWVARAVGKSTPLGGSLLCAVLCAEMGW